MKTSNIKPLLINYKELRENTYYPETYTEAKEDILTQLDYFTSLGLNTYLTGLVDVFDISFANILIEYRKQHPKIELIILTHDKSLDYFHGTLKEDFKNIIKIFNDNRISRSLNESIFIFPNNVLTEVINMKVIYYHPFGDGGVVYGYNRDTYLSNTHLYNILNFDNKLL